MAIELPEATTLARQMDAALAGKRISHADLGPKAESLVRQGFIYPKDAAAFAVRLVGRTVAGATPRGKWIFVQLDDGQHLLLTLETGGQVLFHTDAAALPAVYSLRVDFSDGTVLTARIIGWGFIKVVDAAELAEHPYPGVLGIAPLDADFTPEALAAILEANAKKQLKAFFVDQRSVAGIGNGYLQDVLFKARLHPKRKAGDLSVEERAALYQAIVETLAEAVRLGGRSGETDLYGVPGGYQPVMGGHLKDAPCPICGAVIEKANIGGSASYICAVCQR